MIRTLAAATALLAFAATAAAQELIPLDAPARPKLKAEAIVTGDLVRVGDLIDNAGVIARVPIFRAPDLGTTGTVPARAVVEAVRKHALVGLDPGDVTDVVVTRASRTIPAADVESALAAALSSQHGLGDPAAISVTFERDLRAIQVEPDAKGEPRVSRITYDARSGRFDATLDLPTGAANRGLLRLSGRAFATVAVVTVQRALERGAVLREADIAIERRPRAEVGRDMISDREHAVGYAVRNAVASGRMLRATDLMKPELVQRGETVTMVYELPGVMLTMRGKAVDGGAEGDVVGVLNEQSKRTLQGVVIAPGRVAISNQPPRLAANLPSTRSNAR